MALIGLAFVWSYVGALHEPRLHGADIAVAGPPSLANALSRGEALDATAVSSRGDAVRRLERRQDLGAVVVGGDGVEILVASAAGVALAQELQCPCPGSHADSGARTRP